MQQLQHLGHDSASGHYHADNQIDNHILCPTVAQQHSLPYHTSAMFMIVHEVHTLICGDMTAYVLVHCCVRPMPASL
jgi:hypothetical protein